ncbi:uncharacterized protein EAF02_011543 [Botrytis sinoallii]|uniref:uncharacterized protein n=1 Tax=Botrytis sinoallii TaxID=1463999 RepID=UPI001900D1D9|nr:uncharacterized protein EAF02_011543 [Botrytis sinoallii]KAF7855284.1 hypothetical protein EAF02_011543 [Botrytis sinoallii]
MPRTSSRLSTCPKLTSHFSEYDSDDNEDPKLATKLHKSTVFQDLKHLQRPRSRQYRHHNILPERRNTRALKKPEGEFEYSLQVSHRQYKDNELWYHLFSGNPNE